MKLNRENQEAEIVRKIKLSWAAFGKLLEILKKNLHNTKKQEYSTCEFYQ